MLVDALTAGLTPPVPQVGEPTYADKIDPYELDLDWPAGARRSTGWSASVVPGPPSGAGG